MTHRIEWLANGKHNKPNLPQLGVVQNVATIKDKRRLGHAVIQLWGGSGRSNASASTRVVNPHLLVVIVLKLVPLGEHGNGVRVLGCCLVCGNDLHVGQQLLGRGVEVAPRVVCAEPVTYVCAQGCHKEQCTQICETHPSQTC